MRILFILIMGVCILSSCGSERKRLNRMIDKVFENAIAQYIPLADSVFSAAPGTFPHSLKPDGTLTTVKSSSWTSGFFPGSLWYLYEYSSCPRIKDLANKYTEQMVNQQNNNHTHDIGFMMFSSYGNSYRLEPDSLKKAVLLNSAIALRSRFNPIVGCIRSWDKEVKPGWYYPVIIDNMMNLELLLWASAETGDNSFADVAMAHANTTMLNHFRSDYSSFHVVNYDLDSGKVLFKGTFQGLTDDSSWARGQGWGLYGYTVMYRYTHEEKYLNHACAIANYIMSYPDMASDNIPYWDYMASKNNSDSPRDASAAAIYASALLELSTYTAEDFSQHCRIYAVDILKTLSSPAYTAKPGTNGRFILKHSTTAFPMNKEVDKPLNYADYYYFEALLRLKSILNQSK